MGCHDSEPYDWTNKSVEQELQQNGDKLQQMLDLAQPGDLILLDSGTFHLTKPLRMQKSGTSGQWVTIRGAAGHKTILDGSKMKDPIIEINQAQYIKLENLYIRNGHAEGLKVWVSHHLEIADLKVENTFGSGIGVFGSFGDKIWCKDIRILENSIFKPNNPIMDPEHNNSKPGHEGITMGRVDGFEVAYNEISYGGKEAIDCKGPTRNGTIHHNYIHHHQNHPFSVSIYVDAWSDSIYNIEIYDNIMHDSGDGVQIQSENSKSVSDIRVHHNLIYNMHWSGLGVSNYSKSEHATVNVQFWNNTIHNTKDGIWLGDYHIQNIRFYNNIISGSRNEMIDNKRQLSFRQQQILFEHNLFFQGNKTQIDKNIYQDPLFRDVSQGDFHLSPESPAIDGGHPDPLFNDPDGSRNDMGAFPYGFN
ncbi:MAG: right-handed parallel beta-helix repeat-containing protein [Candidatus Cyclobacteriaceae bacterium M3_2C_046]